MNNCSTCNKDFEGRSNQKFCSISCKNKYHNQRNKERESSVLEINKILHRNWTTLHKLYEIYRSAPIPSEVVKAHGCNLTYYTHTHNSPIGEKYIMVYDLGYKQHIDDQIQIIRMD